MASYYGAARGKGEAGAAPSAPRRRRWTPGGAGAEAAGAGKGAGKGAAGKGKGYPAGPGGGPAQPSGPAAEPLWYFGFGANINPWKLRVKRRILPLEEVPGSLPGWRLVFNHKGGMGNIEPLADGAAAHGGPSAVHGMLLKLTAKDMDRLSQIEHEYSTTDVDVESYDGRSIRAKAYVSPPEWKLPTYPAPPERYLNLIKEGCASMGIEQAYQAWLQTLPSIKGERGPAYYSCSAAQPRRSRSPQGAGAGAGAAAGGGGDGPLHLAAATAFAAEALLVDIGANLGKCSPQDLAQQLARAAAARVSRIVLTGCSVKGSQDAQRICERWGGEEGLRLAEQHLGAAGWAEWRGAGIGSLPQLSFTAGVHPHDAKSCNERTLGTLRALAGHARCVAVGECGLDYDRMFSPREVQLEWFRRQVGLAKELGMPLFLHERDRDAAKGAPLGSARELLEVLHASGVEPGRVCVHCFTGSRETLEAYVSAGYYVGLTGFVGMEKRGNHVRELLKTGALPLRQLMIETDCPFMMPDRRYIPAALNVQGKKNEACVMPAVCRAVAECLGRPEGEVAAATTDNAVRFFGL